MQAKNLNQITVNLDRISAEIASAARSYGRDPDTVRLLAVSKRHPVAAIRAAHAWGQDDFGENYVGEAVEKIEQLPDTLTWHFIGAIQSNKTRLIASHFQWVHTIDRMRIARRLSDQRESQHDLNVLIQVNLGGDAQRAGVTPESALDLAEEVNGLPRLALRGLMVLPPPEETFDAQRHHFARLAELGARGRARELPLTELSMGMSGDLRAAIAEGATWVRVGTGVFGPRPAQGASNR